MDSTPQQVELHAGDGIKQLTFYNARKPGIHLIKVDADDPSKVIPNVKFTIRSVAGDYGPEEFTTNEQGIIDLSKLPVGAYEVREISCPGCSGSGTNIPAVRPTGSRSPPLLFAPTQTACGGCRIP